MTIQLSIPPETAQMLQELRYSYPHPIVQRRAEVLWLKSLGLPHQLIAQIAGVCENTMRDYFVLYQTGGLEGLKVLHSYRPTSALQPQATTLEAHFRDKPVATIKKAQAEIEHLTGIKRSPTQVRHFMIQLGLRCRKVGMLPAKADPDKQAEYLAQEIEPRLAEAQAGKRAVFFVDAAHVVLAPFLGFLWSFVRVFIKAPAGRQRFNVLGALNAKTHELVMVTNDAYINAESVCELLRKLAALNLGVPITLFLDNARYQKCALVIALAESLHIELCFLPAYSPNLNLIERLWKFVKSECLYSEYYADFASFKAAITTCLEQTHSTHKSALDTLLTLKFQLFEKAQFMPV
jgi:transposase